MTAYIDFDIRVKDRDVERMLTAVNTVISPLGMMGFLKSVATPYVRTRAAQRFASEGDDVSGKWAPLQPATQEIRERLDLPISADHPINRRTGDLEAYITQSDSDVQAFGMGAQMTYPGKLPGSRALNEKMSTAQTGRAHPSTVKRPVLGLGITDLAYVIGGIAVAIKEAAR